MSIDYILKKFSSNLDIAIIENQTVLTYHQLHNECAKISITLNSIAKKFMNIGIFINNSSDYIKAYFSIAYTNKNIVPFDPEIKFNEFINLSKNCKTAFFITNTKNYENLLNLLNLSSNKFLIYNISNNKFEILNNMNSTIYIENTDINNSTKVILGTSGTSSNSKRVSLSSKNLLTNIQSIIKSLTIKKTDITLISLPIYLASANTSQFLTHFYLGAKVVIMDGIFFPNKFMQHIEKYKITNFTGTPYMMNFLLNYKYTNNYNLSSLRYMCFGGGPVNNEIFKNMIKKFSKVDIIKMYGLTEASARLTHLFSYNDPNKFNSVGQPIPGVSIRIIDSNNTTLNTNEIGEIIASGNNIMKSYYNNESATKIAFTDNWLHTGDIGKIDDDGFVYVLGRKKNIIISNGYNIYPEEIEQVLFKHPNVLEAYAYGVSDEFYGEKIHVNIVPKIQPNESLKINIMKYLKKNLSSIKIPHNILFVKTINKTKSGKTKRFFKS